MRDELKEYYENYDEGGRLNQDNAHKIEFLTTAYYFDKILPTGSHILDACAGEGNYAFYLAEQGHKVVACDLVEKHVAAIKTNSRAEKLRSVQVADVLDLSRFDEGSFDVVLCIALYHLFDPVEREKCIAQCLRVLKPGGVFAFAYISRHAIYITHFDRGGTSADFLSELHKTGKNLVFCGMNFG